MKIQRINKMWFLLRPLGDKHQSIEAMSYSLAEIFKKV